MVNFKILAVSAATAFSGLASAQTSSSTTAAAAALPTVDLGYAVHRAQVNTTGQYYSFYNIRYAAPPVRFSAPTEPKTVNRTVNDGSQTFICPQANPGWLGAGVASAVFNTPVANLTRPPTTVNLSAISNMPAGQSEDCLFLDVYSPVNVFDAAQKNTTKPALRPVLVMIYGGGYTFGNKGVNPAGLLHRAKDDGGDGILFVAMNYRLGAFGWMSSPSYQQNATGNVGLYDQRLALHWVQKNIHKFGGDKDQVTVIGESAGGGSIFHQITAWGGRKETTPFQRAILQSPAWQPIPSNYQKEMIYSTTLTYASLVSGRSITNVNQLRNLTSDEMYKVNEAVITLSPFGTFTYGPMVDGDFVPALPGNLMLHGQYDKSVKILVGHNSNEGKLFASPFISNATDLLTYIKQATPSITDNIITYASNALYPLNFNGSQPYTNYYELVSLLVAEFAFTCNSQYLNSAFRNSSYGYYFNAPPGLHGADIGYTYANGAGSNQYGSPINLTVSDALQDYITSFAMTGNPNEPGVPFFPIYGENSTNTNVGLTLGMQAKDTTANPRCDWWQKALYF